MLPTCERRAPLLSVSELRVRFGGVLALDGPSLTVDADEICGLIGPNGAGKTTLFNCVSRLYQPESGSVSLKGQDLLALRPDQVADAGVARTFQEVGLFHTQTVLENVMTGALHRSRPGLVGAAIGRRAVSRGERRERAASRELLAELGLSNIEHHVAAGLPIGTLKRIELARALMMRPTLLMLDEPANGLIAEEVHELADLIRSLRDSRGFSVLLVEHHMGMVMSICDRIVVLNFGRKLADGRPSDVQVDPAVVEAYLGVAP